MSSLTEDMTTVHPTHRAMRGCDIGTCTGPVKSGPSGPVLWQPGSGHACRVPPACLAQLGVGDGALAHPTPPWSNGGHCAQSSAEVVSVVNE